MMQGWRVVSSVAVISFRSVLSQKILYNVFFASCLLLLIGYTASLLMVVGALRAMLHFGGFAVHGTLMLGAIFFGASMLPKEFERRTIQLALSRPVSVFQFVLGSFLGLAGVLLLNTFILMGILGGALVALGLPLDLPLFSLSGLFLWMQLLIVCALAMACSWVFAPSLAFMMALGAFFMGSNISTLIELEEKTKSSVSKGFLQVLRFSCPHLERLQLFDAVYYGLYPSVSEAWTSVLYGLLWVLMPLFLVGLMGLGRQNHS